MRIGILLIGLSLAGGCAKYEYDVLEPPDLARHIGPKWEAIQRDPLDYRLRSYENRLVMHIHNPTNEAITLLGDRSYIVAPDGQSHPLYSQSIAPNTFIRIIFPPMRPYWEGPGPSYGFGFGFGHVWHSYPYGPYYGGYWAYPYYPWYGYDQPRYYVLYDGNDRTFWVWKDQSDVKVKLIFQRGKETFSHEFVFHRKKM